MGSPNNLTGICYKVLLSVRSGSGSMDKATIKFRGKQSDYEEEAIAPNDIKPLVLSFCNEHNLNLEELAKEMVELEITYKVTLANGDVAEMIIESSMD